MKLSLVIPTINSGNYIIDNARKTDLFLSKLDFLEDYEIIIAAQTSRDNTFEVLRQLQHETSTKYKPLFIPIAGKGIGLTEGFKAAKHDWVLMMDDDLPYPFESLKEILSVKDCDVVIASRRVQEVQHEVPFLRHIASSSYLFLVKFFLGIPQTDIQAGMKLINKSIFKKLPYPESIGYAWDTELLYLANSSGFRIVEVPVKCIHKPNQLVVLKAAFSMFVDLLRIWWRHRVVGRYS